MTRRSTITWTPDGREYEIVVQPSPRVGLVSTPSRLWNTLTRDRSWWVTIEGDRWPWPVLRERFSTEAAADRRAGDLERAMRTGATDLTWPAWRRRTMAVE